MDDESPKLSFFQPVQGMPRSVIYLVSPRSTGALRLYSSPEDKFVWMACRRLVPGWNTCPMAPVCVYTPSQPRQTDKDRETPL
jgi:hypothetical protein